MEQPFLVVRLVTSGAESVILGRTEIELLLGDGDVEVPLFPTTGRHVDAAVAAALAGSAPPPTIDR
jgi:aspartate racemase